MMLYGSRANFEILLAFCLLCGLKVLKVRVAPQAQIQIQIT